ncbi:MAG: hypothetical protein LBD66_00775 [Holosporales bacterium]|jgi:hypothetical protein|nr:hypothetical protein [Holosporales bacterium]
MSLWRTLLRSFGLSFMLLGGSSGLLLGARQYHTYAQQEEEKALALLQKQRQSHKALHTLAHLLDPESSLLRKEMKRRSPLSAADFAQALGLLAERAGLSKITQSPVPNRAEAMVLEIQSPSERALLTFLQNLEEVCPGIPFIEKILFIPQKGKTMKAKLRLVRWESRWLTTRNQEPFAPVLKPSSFLLFTSMPKKQPSIPYVESILCSGRGPRVAIAGQWFPEGAQVDSWTIQSIHAHKILLKNVAGQERTIKIGAPLPSEKDSAEDGHFIGRSKAHLPVLTTDTGSNP